MEIIAVYKVTDEIEKPLTIEHIEKLVLVKKAEYLYSCQVDVDFLVDAEEELNSATIIIAFYLNDSRLLNKQLNWANIHPIVSENLNHNTIINYNFREVEGQKVAEVYFDEFSV